uniref:Bromodomain adjacent to zinc finger domain protein 1A n=1 Tax=Geotrypetes seraphini TaxID=260995 RepID=A0A6P8RQ69_GEOSA|nr:bromodomain adjacent to zinc finger domain protein 1A [Geotrypetes seraphini]XP_033807235.1 bromodomain adjacent to zinc finger domain protein 1A [Geotrypetes seraphini]XP_033807236.1 bromodomain adjacent to zinc finger domain protein 1A [Geotrypetes seraphini]
MPLLHKQPFTRRELPADLRPNEEVFYCRVTKEIFRDYDEFFERTILCNSLVWSCAVTGKSGLTYEEAIESEKKAKHSLQNFPEPLIVPLLYLTTLTHRARLHEMCDDIFAYVKDRFFVGETVEVVRNNGARLHCKILEVKAPLQQNGMSNGYINSSNAEEPIVISDSDEEPEPPKASALNGKKTAITNPSLFKYKVKPIKKELYESVTVRASQISRKPNLFNRDHLKLFLKQHCEAQNGVMKTKASSLVKYKILEKNFYHYFPDEPPTFMFTPANRRQRHRHPDHYSVSNQERLDNWEREELLRPRENMKTMAVEKETLKKERADTPVFKKNEKESKEKRREEWKKMLEEEKLKKKEEKERLKLEKEKEREKIREEKRKYAEYLKLWSKPREDMECDDLKELPVPTPVKTRLPPESFGDALMVLEFLKAFGELFDLQDEFPEGVTLEVLEEALVGNDPEGPLCELLFFFLTAIFQAMAEEEEEVAKEQLTEADTKDLTEALDEDTDPTKCALTAVVALAAAWPQLHQGCSLKSLDLDSCTVSEILRLHILASGADVTSANAKYRYQKRGGFDATDDACMELRLNNPALLKKLSSTLVYDLTPGEKLKILHALCGKLLTLVSTRDFIEDYVEILRQAKQEFRELKAEQHRREREEAAARIRKKREEKLKEQELKMKDKQERIKEDDQSGMKERTAGDEEQDLNTSNESRETEQKEHDQDAVSEDEEEILSIQRGRRGRRGLKEAANQDLDQLQENLEPLNAEEEETLKWEQQRKEQELIEKIQSATACTNVFPLGRDRLYRRYWIFSAVPGLFIEEDYSGLTEDMLLPRSAESTHLNGMDLSQESIKAGKHLKSKESASSTDQTSLSPQPVVKPNRWCYYSTQEQLEQLIEALNIRGHRENALKDALLQEKNRICKQLQGLSLDRFHMPVKPLSESKPLLGRGRGQISTDTSLMSAEKQLELRLRDLLIDIEDRIYQGTLGSIKVPERQSWRAALEHGWYDLLNEETRENGPIKMVNFEEMEVDDQKKLIIKDRIFELKTEIPSSASTCTNTPQLVNNAVHYLALALHQIEQGIERRFLKSPLGDAEDKKDLKVEKKKKEEKKKREEDHSSEKDDASDSGRLHKTVLDRWRESLVSSTSLSQVFLHLSTLDRSIIWSKSILNARCKMCRKKGDAENMLLCDGCDRGHHIYCIRPKLKIIPDGDWFCPECCPKQRSRRLSSRQRNSEESDEEDTDEEMRMEDEEEDEGLSEEEDEEKLQQVENEEESLPRRGRSQVRLPLKTRGTGRGSQRQDTGKVSRSQQSTPKQTYPISKIIGRGTGRKTRSSPVPETKQSSRLSHNLYLSQSMLEANGSFIEMVTSRGRGRGRGRGRRRGRGVSQSNRSHTSENSPSVFRLFQLDSTGSAEKARHDSTQNLPPRTKGRGKKRQFTDIPTPESLSRRSSSRHYGVHELSACEQLIVELVRHDDSWPFMKLVSKLQVPDYYDIVKHPIALNVIREKVNKCEYKLASEFINDIELMFSNCFEYNPHHTNEAKAGARLQAFFFSQAQKLGLNISHSNMDQSILPAKRSRI